MFSFFVLFFITSSSTFSLLLSFVLVFIVPCYICCWASRCSGNSVIVYSVWFLLRIPADIPSVQAKAYSFPPSFHASACVGPRLGHDHFLLPSLPPFLPSLFSFLSFYTYLSFPVYHVTSTIWHGETDSTVNNTTRLATFIQGLCLAAGHVAVRSINCLECFARAFTVLRNDCAIEGHACRGHGDIFQCHCRYS